MSAPSHRSSRPRRGPRALALGLPIALAIWVLSVFDGDAITTRPSELGPPDVARQLTPQEPRAVAEGGRSWWRHMLRPADGAQPPTWSPEPGPGLAEPAALVMELLYIQASATPRGEPFVRVRYRGSLADFGVATLRVGDRLPGAHQNAVLGEIHPEGVLLKFEPHGGPPRAPEVLIAQHGLARDLGPEGLRRLHPRRAPASAGEAQAAPRVPPGPSGDPTEGPPEAP